MGVFPYKKGRFFAYICYVMNPNRSLSNFQGAVYQYTYNAKMASGVCLQTITDYSPFGVTLDGRTIENDFYRRGFNGMEKDDELKGGGNSYDFGARMYDARVGRWFSRDPLASKYPQFSPMVFTANNPIAFIDRDGNEFVIYYVDKNGKSSEIKVTSYEDAKALVSHANNYVRAVATNIVAIQVNGGSLEFESVMTGSDRVDVKYKRNSAEFAQPGAEGNEKSRFAVIFYDPEYKAEEYTDAQAERRMQLGEELGKLIESRESKEAIAEFRKKANEEIATFGNGQFMESDENLIHEIGHAHSFLTKGKKRYNQNVVAEPTIKINDTKEEEDAINIENTYRVKKGKGKRPGGHYGGGEVRTGETIGDGGENQ